MSAALLITGDLFASQVETTPPSAIKSQSATKPRPPGRPRNPNIETVRKQFRCSRATAYRLIKDGVPTIKARKRNRLGVAYDKENRAAHDFYPTDPRTVESLLTVESFSGIIWEPCCGDGAISKVLEATGHSVISADLINRGYGQSGVDFLLDYSTQAEHIITNPPYNLSDEFVKHALDRVHGKVCMLLRSVWIQPAKRAPLRDKLSRIWQLTKRPRMNRNGEEGKDGSQIDFSWFVWDRSHTGPAVTRWLP